MTFDSREQRGLTRRKLRFALFCSLLLHGLVLSLGVLQPALQESTPGSVPNLMAHLRLAPAAMAPATQMATVEQLRLPAYPRPHPRLTQPVLSSMSPARPEQKPLKVHAPQLPDQALPATADVLPMKQMAGLDESVASATASGLTEGAASDLREGQMDRPSVEGVSADGLRRYRLGLAAQARRFKRYPAQALVSGWSGTAEIFLVVDGAGLVTVTLNKSSTHAVLDQAAQTMIEAGAQRTPVPEALRGKAFSVVLPVVFDISDE